MVALRSFRLGSVRMTRDGGQVLGLQISPPFPPVMLNEVKHISAAPMAASLAKRAKGHFACRTC